MEKALFGAGCFWGVEESFRKIQGVVKTEVGYTGGHTLNPSYQSICEGDTNHVEVVLVEYDKKKISYDELLNHFWKCHDPTTLNRQGPDVGTQYRSAIFLNNSENLNVVKTSKTEFQSLLHSAGFNDITTEIKNNIDFYFAEIYHQQYLYKNPNGYCGLGGCGVKFK